MTVKSDRWIATQCLLPTHALGRNNDLAIKGITHTAEVIDNWRARLHAFELDPTHLKEMVDKGWKPMIEPFAHGAVRTKGDVKIISYGLSSYGYDARLASELKLFTNVNSAIVDPRNMDERCMVTAELRTDEDGLEYALLPPNAFMLGHTVEYFRIPRDVVVVCMGKSTWARAGVNITVTPLEPEWEGQVVIEIANLTSLPVKVYVNQGICQFMFHQSDDECMVSYKDRGGKYQNQTGITHAKV